MSETAVQFEIKDVTGSTLHFSGTATLSVVEYPASPSEKITEVLLHNLPTNPSSRLLYVSFDGGTNWKTIYNGDVISWSPKSTTSVKIKGSHSSGTAWEALVNFESPGE